MSRIDDKLSKIPLVLFVTAGTMAFAVAIFGFIELGTLKSFYIGTGLFWFAAAALYTRKSSNTDSEGKSDSQASK